MEIQVSRKIAERAAVVILAAGKGTRMGRENRAKVCFEIDGVPAINRIIQTFKKNHFRKFLIVVGSMAEQVMETVGQEQPQVIFVYQRPQLGTGHAAKIAAGALQDMGHTAEVVAAMGDKYIESEAVEMLVDGYIRQQTDMAILTTPRTRKSNVSYGRVLQDKSGQVIGIIEQLDIARQAIADELRERLAKGQTPGGATIRTITKRYISNPKKLARAAAELVEMAEKTEKISRGQLKQILEMEKYQLRLGDKSYTARQIEKECKQYNSNLFLFKAEAFYQGIALIDNNNAQGEYYLTDVVKHLGNITDTAGQRRFKIRAAPAASAELIQGFNSPDELLAIQDYVRRGKKAKAGARESATGAAPKLTKKQYGSVRQWLEKIASNRPSFQTWLKSIYSGDEGLHAEKAQDLQKVLKCYGKRFGFEQKVVIVRAPGRINLMGRHVDHRGGYNNVLALHRETIVAAGLRDDDNVIAISAEPKKFKAQYFNISELMGGFAWSDWVNFVNSDWVRNLLHTTAGEWGNYIKAAMLRLQHHYQDLKIRGLNIALYGSVPMAAGLSSSSTIVVAALQAAIALNNLELTGPQFIDLCGEGEWFVGSRGGSGDHAAIYLGQRDKIAQVGYLPFHVARVTEAPKDYQIIIANSHIKAAKSAAAKHQFNSKIASYNLGLALLKLRCPQIAEIVEYVRDLNPERLGCTTSEIYRLLLKVPQYMTRKEFAGSLTREQSQMLETNFATHKEPRHYQVRGVLLFGAAECLRSKICLDYLAKGDIAGFGQLMKISHDGDRVAQQNDTGRYQPYQYDCSDTALNKLMVDLVSEEPQRVLQAQLYMQPGSYGCSTEEIDRMVDIACQVPGVAGAQIAGAGLGGCIMILAQNQAAAAVRHNLIKQYYQPRNLPPAIINCTTVAGAGLAEF